MDMSLSKLWEIVKDKESQCDAVHGITKNWTRLIDFTFTYGTPLQYSCLENPMDGGA